MTSLMNVPFEICLLRAGPQKSGIRKKPCYIGVHPWFNFCSVPYKSLVDEKSPPSRFARCVGFALFPSRSRALEKAVVTAQPGTAGARARLLRGAHAVDQTRGTSRGGETDSGVRGELAAHRIEGRKR